MNTPTPHAESAAAPAFTLDAQRLEMAIDNVVGQAMNAAAPDLPAIYWCSEFMAGTRKITGIPDTMDQTERWVERLALTEVPPHGAGTRRYEGEIVLGRKAFQVDVWVIVDKAAWAAEGAEISASLRGARTA